MTKKYSKNNLPKNNLLLIIGRIVRVPNLVIIAATLLVLKIKILGGGMGLTPLNYFLMILGTVLIAAAGNIINDILDYEIDEINKPNKVIIHHYLSPKSAYCIYIILNAISVIMAIIIGELALFLFYGGAIVLLYLYSNFFKKMPVLGNLIIALLCTWVVIEFWWIEYAYINEYWQVMLLFYTTFAFLATWIREIVKDIEDITGDRAVGAYTMPIWLGESKSVLVIKCLGVFLLATLLSEIYFFYTQNSTFLIIYTSLLLVIPLIYFLCYWDKYSYSQLSLYLKIYMLIGLLLLLM